MKPLSSKRKSHAPQIIASQSSNKNIPGRRVCGTSKSGLAHCCKATWRRLTSAVSSVDPSKRERKKAIGGFPGPLARKPCLSSCPNVMDKNDEEDVVVAGWCGEGMGVWLAEGRLVQDASSPPTISSLLPTLHHVLPRSRPHCLSWPRSAFTLTPCHSLPPTHAQPHTGHAFCFCTPLRRDSNHGNVRVGWWKKEGEGGRQG